MAASLGADYLAAWSALIDRTQSEMLAPDGPLYFVGGAIDYDRLSGSDQPTPAVFWTFGISSVTQRQQSRAGSTGSGGFFATPGGGRHLSHIERQSWDAVVCVRHQGDIRYAHEAAKQAGPILGLLDDTFINFRPGDAFDALAVDDQGLPPQAAGDYLLFPRRYFTSFRVYMPTLTE